ncbi:MAG TPA: transcription antitermination factor NusB, partial [Gemmatimonadales bacterium]|nr:transcription antitermination factor NusB [Gemmatimonadales bacterium]
MTLRPETKSRARALQLLYAWELQGAPPIPGVATGLARLTGPEPRILDRAEELARGVITEVGQLDAEAARASENWRLNR